MVIMPHVKEAVVARPLLSVVCVVRMVYTHVPPNQCPLHRSSVCLTRMSSLSLVVRPPRRKSMGTSHTRGRQLRRYYKPLLFAKILQNRILGLLKGRTSSDQLEVK
jgi:hypothetical protein